MNKKDISTYKFSDSCPKIPNPNLREVPETPVG